MLLYRIIYKSAVEKEAFTILVPLLKRTVYLSNYLLMYIQYRGHQFA